MVCGKRSFPQFEQLEKLFGFFAWCDLREFFFAFDVRLRGTAIVSFS